MTVLKRADLPQTRTGRKSCKEESGFLLRANAYINNCQRNAAAAIIVLKKRWKTLPLGNLEKSRILFTYLKVRT